MSSSLTWQPFDQFMSYALYDPKDGYYTSLQSQIGLEATPNKPSDFATAPVLSPYFGKTLAAQVAQALSATDTDEVWEFGAGTGALAVQMLLALGDWCRRYHIVDVSGNLQAVQKHTIETALQATPSLLAKVRWQQALPAAISGVMVGNEVLDAMPVKLLARVKGAWFERGVTQTADGYQYADVPTDLEPPFNIAGNHDYVTEIHPQAQAFIQTLADKLLKSQEQTGKGGAILMIDYGFGEREYYHPQRSMGTVMCHKAHQSDADPLVAVGQKDITAHVNFTGIALAAQDAGLHVNGYTSQGRFLLNCGILDLLAQADFNQKTMAQKLITEHEMGELFKVICLSTLEAFEPLGFAVGDRSHTL